VWKEEIEDEDEESSPKEQLAGTTGAQEGATGTHCAGGGGCLLKKGGDWSWRTPGLGGELRRQN
jgi:hypothetical protein